MIDHDQLFKTLIMTFFADFLRLVSPPGSPALEVEKARFLSQEHFSRPARGRRVALDLVAEVPARRAPPRLIHIEIERVYRRAAGRRMVRYYMHLRLDHRRPVVPIMLFLRGGPPGVDRLRVIEEIDGSEINRFTYLAFGLSRCRAEDYLERPEALAWGLAALMRPATMDRAEHKLACLRAIARGELSDLQRFLLLETVETYLVLEGAEKKRYDNLVAEQRNREVNAMEMTWSQQLLARGRAEGIERGRAEGIERGRAEGIERGRAEGIERGRAEGEVAGVRRTLTRLLEKRFGPLDDDVRRRLAAISDAAALERLVDRALEARSLRQLGLAADG
ncbi:MAG: hypothetical protein D6696_13560 [Acidobacteria bacterium]|nr:MAG: hypothetical protein D6696_13560 [Acidobacteriota bacterium]